MYRKIMVPLDLAHIEHLGKAIDVSTDLATHYGIPLCFVGVTAETPTEIAHTPHEYAGKLAEFGADIAKTRGIDVDTAAYSSHDPAAELHKALIEAARDKGADLIVMASHIPGVPEHIFASHAGAVASHSEVSVFVVR